MPVITFLGGARTVTGSKYLLDLDGSQVMVDCGLFQGDRQLRDRNWRPHRGPRRSAGIGGPHARPPRPLRVPAQAACGRLRGWCPRDRRDHRAGVHHPRGLGPPPGGGGTVRQSARLLQASSGPAALRRRCRGGDAAALPAARPWGEPRGRTPHHREPVAGGPHPGVLHRAHRPGRYDGRVQRRPGATESSHPSRAGADR